MSYLIKSRMWGRLLAMDTEVEDWTDVDTLPFPFEKHWLPRRPLAGKSKHGGYYRMSRDAALERPYIEANPLVMKSLVITDHDGGRADEIVGLAGLPPPSYIAMNPHLRNGHIVYALATPVVLTDAGRRRPVNLLSRVESGLNDMLGGDVAYGGRTTKNPRHQEHLPLWGPDYAVYSLKELADPLERLGVLPKWAGARERREKLATTDTGRNVEIFEVTRKWSYPKRGDYTDLGRWESAVSDYAWDRNVELIGECFHKGPLLFPEVHQIARSISRWTWRHIRRSFSEEQARRGKMSAEKAGAEELARRGRKGGQTMTEKRRNAIAETNRRRGTRFDMDAIIADALEG
ncbi:replication initiation protein [Nocardia sp. NPDC058499]|uniref:replication initiation protein n=1 Tax=Nocardia sp. NPDC058499 TaxID=3346530 RepID=UPI0036632B75